MSAPEFLVADPRHHAWRSPLRRGLAGAPDSLRDVTAEATDGPLGPAAGVAGIEVEAPSARTLLARLTALDLDALPAVGAVARVQAYVTAESDGRYRIWFPQEYSDYLAAVVLDAWTGIAR